MIKRKKESIIQKKKIVVNNIKKILLKNVKLKEQIKPKKTISELEEKIKTDLKANEVIKNNQKTARLDKIKAPQERITETMVEPELDSKYTKAAPSQLVSQTPNQTITEIPIKKRYQTQRETTAPVETEERSTIAYETRVLYNHKPRGRVYTNPVTPAIPTPQLIETAPRAEVRKQDLFEDKFFRNTQAESQHSEYTTDLKSKEEKPKRRYPWEA